ncbi:MAG: valine--tRNA ligase [Acidobacteria bacterium]|nr:valine--tRNA ligase [Acidobacteriota bacterium]
MNTPSDNLGEIPKSYDPKLVEDHWWMFWERERLFVADVKSSRPSFVIVIPPPNVTGSLHMGHMLVYTLHDIVVRRKRMLGFNTLWLPGTDHAGIATQNVVERQLAAEGKSRHDLGREAFEKRVWEWKERSGNTILRQLRRLGGSCDWTRERFTLDEGLSRAVREVFVRLYEEGLIYRGKRLINWCVRCRTALSDLEVKAQLAQGKLAYIRYPLKDSADAITVATTRPETMLGDTAVAVNPNDERYRHLAGKTLILPMLNREIPLITDEFVDPAFGTGLVKVTPAHDPNDFEMGLRHKLEMISVIDEDGRMTEAAGPFQGMDRFQCRREVLKALEALGLLETVADHAHNVGHCDRCKTVVEPALSTQWFVRMQPLAEPAIQAVEDWRIRFVPHNWSKTYFEWMRNIRDWCISRQLWWGHRIPAWYCERCGEINVARETPAHCAKCGHTELRQETDVLDTWFSSGLWPFSSFGWPDETEDLKKFYPTSVLITGFDIIFFWVARMIVFGLKFMGDVPFRTVYINSLVRDAEGQKMSKSKGNVIDPLDVMEQYGTDAVRFTLAIMAAPGTDISLSPEKMLSYRAFANKIWNASRFVLLNLESLQSRMTPGFSIAAAPQSFVARKSELSLIDRWILSRLNATVNEINRALEEFRFHEASHELYHFFWHELCDWYIEFVKPKIVVKKRAGNDLSCDVLIFVFDQALRLLHPFMPFITEELWQRLPHEGRSLAVQEFPKNQPDLADGVAEKQVEALIEVVVKIRDIRRQMNVEPARRIQANLASADPTLQSVLAGAAPYIQNLARCEQVNILPAIPMDNNSSRSVVAGVEIELPLAGMIDVQAERERLEREIAKIEKEAGPIQAKLNSREFVNNAPAKVVQLNESRLAEFQEKLAKLNENLKRMAGL